MSHVRSGVVTAAIRILRALGTRRRRRAPLADGGGVVGQLDVQLSDAWPAAYGHTWTADDYARRDARFHALGLPPLRSVRALRTRRAHGVLGEHQHAGDEDETQSDEEQHQSDARRSWEAEACLTAERFANNHPG